MKTARVGASIALAGLLWLALAAWALMSPVGAEPDGDYHLAMIYCAAGEAECVPEGQREGPCFAMRPDVPASCSDWGTRTLPETDGINTEHYPPFYYLAMSPLTGETLADTTVAVRLANVTLAVAMMLASLALTAPGLRRALAFSWPIAAVPLGMYFIASINPSAWVIIGFAAIWGPLLTHLTRPGGAGAIWDASRSRAVVAARVGFVLLAAFVSMAGRTEGALFLPLVVAAVTVFVVPRSFRAAPARWWRDLLLPIALLALAALFLALYARPKAESLNPGSAVSPSADNFAGWDVVQHTINSFLGTLGLPGVPGSGLGTYDVPVPALAAGLIVVAYGATALFGLGVMYGRKALALVLFSSAAVTVTAVLWSRENWEYFQPRYFLPLSFVWLGLLLLPRPDAGSPALAATTPAVNSSPDNGSATPTSLQTGLIVAAVSVANAAAMLSTILRFQRGVLPQASRDPLTPAAPDVSPFELARAPAPAWWWESAPQDPFAVWTWGSLAFTAALILVWSLQRHRR